MMVPLVEPKMSKKPRCLSPALGNLLAARLGQRLTMIGVDASDGRKDEFLGEGGLEVKAPENHLYLEGVTGLTV